MRKRKTILKQAPQRSSFFVKTASVIVIIGIFVGWLIYARHHVEAGWYGNAAAGSGTWTTRKKITVNKSKVVGSSALANYPMLVSITDADLASKAQSNGNDILFTSSDGTTKLDHEIENYTSATGTLIAWVRVPSLSPTADTIIYMYYGNPSASSQQNATGVWDNNYRFVQHMEETSGTTMTDSSPAGKNGTKLSATEPNPLSSGKINGAQTFDATNDSVEILDSTNPTAYTIEGWVRLNDNTSVQIMARTNSGGMGSHSHELRINASSQLQNYLWDGSMRAMNGTTTLQTGVWYYVAGTAINNGNMYVYVNGVSEGTPISLGTMWTGGDRYHISDPAFGDGYGFLNGDLDELRFSSSVRTPEWIATNYNNQSSPSTFYAITNTPETNPTTILQWKFEEGTGTSAYDTSSYGHTGILSGTAPSWEVQSKASNKFSLKFNGSTNYVSRTYTSATDTDLNPGTGSITVSSWFRHPSTITGQDTLISRFATGGYKVYMKSSGVMCFGIDDATSSTWGTNSSGTPDNETCSTASYADSQWHFIEAVKNGTTSITLYIDGRQVGTPVTSITANSISGSTPAFYVGIDANGTSNAWDGFIDEVKIKNVARSANDVKADYNLQGNIKGASAAFGEKSTENLTDGLLGWWKMEDNVSGNNQTITDNSGNNNNATTNYGANATGMDCTVSGKFDRGCNFDGIDDYINAGSGISLSNKSFTLAGWVKRAYGSGTIETLFYQGTNQDSIALYVADDDSINCVLRNSDNPTGIGSALISDANWHHLVCTFDTNTKKLSLYLDGQSDSATTSNYTISATGTMYFGKYLPTSIYSSGRFDDLRIYNRALSATEVVQLYSWGPEPVGYWKLDEGIANNCGSANDSCDSSGNSNNGDWYGDATPTTGKYGKGVTFDGNDDYIKILHSPSLNFQYATTLEAWVYPTSTTGNQVVIGKQPIDGSGSYWFFRQNTTAWQCIVDSGGNYSDPGSVYVGSAVILNTWQHIACSFDGSVIKVYVNGLLKGSTNYTGTIRTSTGPVHIGSNGSLVQDFNGKIDDVRIYDYGRTAKQIVEDMNGGRPTISSNTPLVYYKFDEGYSTVANNSGSVSGYNGTLTNIAAPATATSGWTKAGKIDSALLFDGGDDYVTRADSGATDELRLNGNNSVTLSAWIKIANLADSSEHHIIGKYSHAGTAGYVMLVYSDGKIGFKINGAANAKMTTNTAVSAGNWYNIICVFDNGNTMKVYVNGRLFESFAITSTTITGSSNPFVIGTASDAVGNTTYTLSGTIDEPKVYGYALSDNDIVLEYNQGRSALLGATYVDPTGAPSYSADKSYCVPGDATSCLSPVAEWKLDEKNGILSYDTSGSANTLSLTNGPVWSPGKYGSSLYFDGSDDYAVSTSSPFSNYTTTVELWWKPVIIPASAKNILGSDSNSNFNISQNSAGTVTVKMGNTSNVDATSATTLSPNTWYHIAATASGAGSTLTLYINGKKESTGTVGTFTSEKIRLGSGSYGGTSYANGSIDQVQIFNYSRTQSQIAWDYNYGGPVGWWKFDECTGSTLYDSSGNGNNGSLSGSSTVGTCNTSSTAWGDGAQGKINSSLKFNGFDDNINLSHPTSLDASSAFTLSAWVKPSSTPNGAGVIAEGWAGGADRVEYEIGFGFDEGINGSSKLKVGFFDGSAWALAQDSTNIATNQWVHIAGTWDGTTLSLYKNGQLIATNTPGKSTAVDTENIYIGRRHDTAGSVNYFPGQIDDARIYNYPLTAQQVKTLYNGNTAVNFTPITGIP